MLSGAATTAAKVAMVSTRPQPPLARGRVAYPSAAAYTPGDAGTAPEDSATSSTPTGPRGRRLSANPNEGAAARRLKSPDMSDREKSTQGLKTWWKAFSQRQTSPPPQKSFRQAPRTMNSRHVFGAPLQRVLGYAAMQISTSSPDDGSLYVWG